MERETYGLREIRLERERGRDRNKWGAAAPFAAHVARARPWLLRSQAAQDRDGAVRCQRRRPRVAVGHPKEEGGEG